MAVLSRRAGYDLSNVNEQASGDDNIQASELPTISRKFSILRKRRLNNLEREYENFHYVCHPRKIRKLGMLSTAERIEVVHDVIIKKALHREVAFAHQVNTWSVDYLVQQVRKNPKFLNEQMELEAVE